MKGQSLCYTLTPTVVGGRRQLPLKSALKVTHSFEKRRLRPISAHNVSTVRDSEKSSITTNIKSTTGFPMSHRWSAYVTPTCPERVAQRAISFLFTTRAYARAVLGVVILSIRPSVRLSNAYSVTKLNDTLQIFLYHTKGQSLCYSDSKSGWSATPPSL